MRYYLCSSLVDYSKMELHNEYHWVEDLVKHVHFPCHVLLLRLHLMISKREDTMHKKLWMSWINMVYAYRVLIS